MRDYEKVSSTMDRNGDYQFYDCKMVAGNIKARWPRKDPDALADDMKQIFCIPRRLMKIRELAHLCAPNDQYYWPTRRHMEQVETLFCQQLHVVLDGHSIDYTIKAVGTASRASKKPWQFTTNEYHIYAKENGLLVKLIGVENIENEVWDNVEEILKSSPG